MNPEFLDIEDVLEIHAYCLERDGGLDGIRDTGLLESAVAQPQMRFGGQYLHADLFEMAAAYLYHITKNHPFVDGNKRTGLAAALTFLELNGCSIDNPTPLLYNLAVDAADGNATKAEVAGVLRSLSSAC